MCRVLCHLQWQEPFVTILNMVAPLSTSKKGLIGDIYATPILVVSFKVYLRCGEEWRQGMGNTDEHSCI